MFKPRWAIVAAAAVAGAVALMVVVAIVLAPVPPGRFPMELPYMADVVDEVPLDAAAASNIDSMADKAWLTQTAAATGIPERALQAYAGAVVAMQLLLPECKLGWNTLAAIGYVESRHGTYGGSTMDANGLVSPTITGPPLDGELFDAIEDTDDGALDGDTTWDRAVGPMQFIPSSWASSGHDGDTNLDINPNDIDDAAYASARYLCADGRPMDGPGWSAAVLSYNNSSVYVQQVYDAAAAYASRAS